MRHEGSVVHCDIFFIHTWFTKTLDRVRRSWIPTAPPVHRMWHLASVNYKNISACLGISHITKHIHEIIMGLNYRHGPYPVCSTKTLSITILYSYSSGSVSLVLRLVSSGGMRGASLRLGVSIPGLRLVASPVDRNGRESARGAASMSLYQSVHMLGNM